MRVRDPKPIKDQTVYKKKSEAMAFDFIPALFLRSIFFSREKA